MSLNSSITSLAPVKYNAQRDVRETRARKKTKVDGIYTKTLYTDRQSTSECDFSIMPKEVCLRRRTQGTRKRFYTDTDMDVFSSLNNIFYSHASNKLASHIGMPQSQEAARIALRKELDFGGVAVTRSACEQGTGASSPELVVLFGGTFTIRNTGPDTIKTGNWVMWDLPNIDPRQRANLRETSDQIPGSKLLVETRPFTPQNMFPTRQAFTKENPADAAQRVKDLADALNKPDADTTADRDFEAAFSDLNGYFNESRGRVIGRALSTAASGKEFDIVLGRYMS